MLAHRLSMHLVLTAVALAATAAPRASSHGEHCSPVPRHAQAREHGQDPTPEQYAALLRAVVVLKIAPYLTRAGTAKDVAEETPYRIAVVGEDDVGAAMLQHLSGKRVGKRPVQVVAVTTDEIADPDVAGRFDLAYVARTVAKDAVTRLVTALRKVPTPLIGERAGFTANGGGVQLFVQENAVRFEVNAEALRKQGVEASSQLLKLSRRGPRK